MGVDFGSAEPPKQEGKSSGVHFGSATGAVAAPVPETPSGEDQSGASLGLPTNTPSGDDTATLGNAAGDTDLTGVGKNARTAILKGLSHTPGMGGDIGEFISHVHDMAMSHIWGRPAEEIRREREAARAVEDTLRKQGKGQENIVDKALRYGRDLPAGHDITAPIFKKHGEYEPTSEPGKYGAAALEGATAIAAAGGAGGGPLSTARNMLAGASSGPAAKTVHDFGGPDWAELAASILAPIVVGGVTAGGQKAGDVLSSAGNEGKAATGFSKNFADPKAALERLRNAPKDELLTPAEITQDPLFANVQDAARSDHAINQEIQSRVEIPRNAQRQDMLASTAPIDADPLQVSQRFQQHLDEINAAAEAGRPTAPPLDESGAGVQGAMKGEDKIVGADIDRFKKTIDPDRTKKALTGDLADYATEVLGETTGPSPTRPLKVPRKPDDPVQERLTAASKLGDISGFSDLIDFDQSLTDAMRQTKHTDPGGYRELVILKGKVKDALNKTVENQHKVEQEQVASGTLSPEDTFAHGLQRQQADFYARTGRTPPRGVEPPPAVDEVNTAADQPAGRPVQTPDAGSDQGVPAAGGVLRAAEAPAGSVPGGTGQAGAGEGAGPTPAERLRLFNQAYGKRKDVFGNDIVEPMIETGMGGKPLMMGAEVAQKAFIPGPKGFETAQTVLAAGGPEGLAHMKDVATGTLQAELAKGGGKPLDQKTLDTWKAQNAGALRAIDEADAAANPGQNSRFSDQFNDAAAAGQAVQAFQKSAAARFLGLDTPDSVIGQVGSYMNMPVGGAEKIAALMDQAKNAGPHGEAIQAGIRRAGADWLKRKFDLQSEFPDPAGGTVNVLGDGLKKFMDQHRNMLEAMFEPDAMKTMDKLADSFGKSITVKTLQATQGSATSKRMSGLLQRQLAAAAEHDLKHGDMTIGNVATIATMGEFMREGISPATLFTAGKLMAAKKAFEIVRNAVDKKLGTNATKVTNMMAEGFYSREAAEAMLQRAVDMQGNPNPVAYRGFYQAILNANLDMQHQSEREGRAEGGAVFDHKAAAKHMVGLVEKARKRDAVQTKPLLQAHDSTVARALAIANRSI